MGRGCVDKQLIIEEAAALANETGFSNVSLKLLSERLNIKAPSLYKHITNLEELKQELDYLENVREKEVAEQINAGKA